MVQEGTQLKEQPLIMRNGVFLCGNRSTQDPEYVVKYGLNLASRQLAPTVPALPWRRFLRRTLGEQKSLAKRTFQGTEKGPHLCGVEAPLATAVEEVFLPQDCLPERCSIGGLHVLVRDLTASLDGHCSPDLQSVVRKFDGFGVAEATVVDPGENRIKPSASTQGRIVGQIGIIDRMQSDHAFDLVSREGKSQLAPEKPHYLFLLEGELVRV